MTTTAVTMMLISLITVWGGLLVSSLFLARFPHPKGGWADHPEIDEDDAEPRQ